MPFSLNLVNDLYYYYASPVNGIVRHEDRGHVRGHVHQLVRSQLSTGSELLRVLHPQYIFSIRHLVFPPDHDNLPSELRGVEHWNWLGQILLQALESDVVKISREIGALIAINQHDNFPGTEVHRIDFDLMNGFFGAAAPQVLDAFAVAREQLQGRERDFLDQLIRSAQQVE